MKQIKILAVIIFLLKTSSIKGQSTGTWIYNVTCEKNTELCSNYIDQVMVVITSQKAAVISIKNHKARERVVISSENDTVYYILDTLGEAYHASKTLIFPTNDSIYDFDLEDSYSVNYSNNECIVYRTSFTSENQTLTKTFWVKDGEEQLDENLDFPNGFIPVINNQVKTMPLKVTFMTENLDKDMDLTYELDYYSPNPEMSYFEIVDGIKLKPLKF